MAHLNLTKEFKKSFRWAFPDKASLIFVFVAISVFAPIVFSLGFNSIPDRRDPLLYLLSSQAQTLGAILALVFTLTLVAAQVATRYSHLLLDRVLSPWAFWYAIPFGTGVILPLLLLNGNFFLWAAQVSLLLAIVCIALLVPFFVAVRRLLSVPTVLRELKEQIIVAASEQESIAAIRSLGNISTGALNLRDYETFALGVSLLAEASLGRDQKEAISLSIGHELRELSLRSSGDRLASQTLVNAMADLTFKAAKEGRWTVIESLLSELSDVYSVTYPSTIGNHDFRLLEIKSLGDAAISANEIVAARRCQRLLYVIGNRALSDSYIDTDLAKSAIGCLGDLAVTGLRSPPNVNGHDSLVLGAISPIELLGIQASQLRRRDLMDWAAAQLRRASEIANSSNHPLTGNAEAALASLEGYPESIPS